MIGKNEITKLIEEISTIRRLVEILAKDKLKAEINQVVTTDLRKKMWNLFNGSNSTGEIAEKAKVSQRAVQMFVKDLQEKDLVVIKKRGYPKRKFDLLFPE